MTAQVPDVLCHRGQRHDLFSNPLEPYFDDDHPQPKFQWSSTANWRAYVATWEIAEDVLFLTALEARVGNRPFGLTDLFPNAAGPVAASWFRGVLRVPLGEMLEYLHSGYASLYERDLFLTVHESRLVLEEVIDNNTGELVESRLTPRGRELFGPEEWAFLEAVRADLGDTTPQLVYADWLEERGDVRSEMVRLSCRLRRAEKESEARSLADRLEGLQGEQAKRGGHYWLWSRLIQMPRRSHLRRLETAPDPDLLVP